MQGMTLGSIHCACATKYLEQRFAPVGGAYTVLEKDGTPLLQWNQMCRVVHCLRCDARQCFLHLLGTVPCTAPSMCACCKKGS